MTATLCACSSASPVFKSDLVTAKRALQGWKKLSPLIGRAPLPWVLLVGMAAFWFRRSDRLKGGALLLTFPDYLRPSELRLLCSEDFVPPRRGVGRTWSVVISPPKRERSTKTGRFDDSAVLDALERRMLEPWLKTLLVGRTMGTLPVSARTSMAHRDRPREQQRTGFLAPEPAPIPTQARRLLFRHTVKSKDPHRGPKTGEMGLAIVRPPLRKGRQSGSDVAQRVGRSSGVLLASTGRDSGPGSLASGTMPCGACGLAQVLGNTNNPAQSFARIHGYAEAHGCGPGERTWLQSLNARRDLFRSIQEKKVTAIGIDLGSATFSQARRHDGRGSPANKKYSHVNGTKKDLSRREYALVQAANRKLLLAGARFRAACHANIPEFMFGSSSSKAWLTPATQELFNVVKCL